jgi:hypothetical protein
MPLSPDPANQRDRKAGWVEPGDLIMGRQVRQVVVEGSWVEITFDDGHVIHADKSDMVTCDLPGKDAWWMRVEPNMQDGAMVGWALVLDLDSDWQSWSVHAEGGYQRFRVELSDQDLRALATATTLPIVMSIYSEEATG